MTRHVSVQLKLLSDVVNHGKTNYDFYIFIFIKDMGREGRAGWGGGGQRTVGGGGSLAGDEARPVISLLFKDNSYAICKSESRAKHVTC